MKFNFLSAKDALSQTNEVISKKDEIDISQGLAVIENYIKSAIKSGEKFVYVPYYLVNNEIKSYLENELGYYVADTPTHRTDCDWDLLTGFTTWECDEIFISWDL